MVDGCPVKIKAAVRGATSRTGLACSLLSIFYPKNDLEGKRLHELNQDVVDEITGMLYSTSETLAGTLKSGNVECPLTIFIPSKQDSDACIGS